MILGIVVEIPDEIYNDKGIQYWSLDYDLRYKTETADVSYLYKQDAPLKPLVKMDNPVIDGISVWDARYVRGYNDCIEDLWVWSKGYDNA